nr:ribosome maturation factor RimP [uncultured Peptostreptococcus sp.]
MKKNIAQKVEELVISNIQDMGYELVDVEYVKEAGVFYLRIIIDHQDGIGLDECEKVSRMINPILDEGDYIEDNYFLEVCSPGIDRILKKDKEFTKYAGKAVEVKLYKNDEILKTKQFEAKLIGLDLDGKIIVSIGSEEKKLDKKEVAQIRLAIEF